MKPSKLLSLRIALVLGAVLLTALATQDPGRFLTSRTGRQLELPAGAPAFQFAVFGDRTGGPAEGIRVLEEAVAEVNLIGPDLVMTVGDLVNGYNATAEWMEQMREFHATMDRLQSPWFPVAGNHDVYWRGPGRPPQEHEDHYEEHFAPLWYAFEHKGAWFVILYSDEPDPKTGERNFSKPESQRMSPVQFEWLRATLAATKGADHVFVFLHHPRWNRGNYGDDWDHIHEILADAGNVRAVFAGHIHRMQYTGPRDGIEYFTLATTGGHQGGSVPEAGYLHHYELVTVRADGIDVVSFPVGSADDPRAITREVSEETDWLQRNLAPVFEGELTVDKEGGVDAVVPILVRNPSRRSLEVEFRPHSDDLFWDFSPDHWRGVVEPKGDVTFGLRAIRPNAGLDAGFLSPQIEISVDYLTETQRFSFPSKRFDIPVVLGELPKPPRPAHEHVLYLDGASGAMVESAQVPLEQGAFTLEAWTRGTTYGGRRGLVTKTEQSEYGIYATDGVPSFIVYLDGAYRTASADEPLLRPGQWHHVAGVFTGDEVRLYVDGLLMARVTGVGDRKLNTLPLVIGGDVDANGRPTSQHTGILDEVRLSKGARYTGESFTPARRHESDGDTLLLLHADAATGPWLHDSSPLGAHARLTGSAQVRKER